MKLSWRTKTNKQQEVDDKLEDAVDKLDKVNIAAFKVANDINLWLKEYEDRGEE